jgi:carboxypeptidase family protein
MTQATVRGLLATLILGAALAWPAAVDACSCVGSSAPCSEVWPSDAVFVGQVVSTAASARGVVELTVIEWFRGARPTRSLVAIVGKTTCAYRFEAGRSYFVYARRTQQGHLSASICSRTRPVQDAADDLAYVRSLSTIVPGSPARIHGRVVLWEYPWTNATIKPIPGVAITATGGGRTFSVVANERGEFEVTGLPLGIYELVPTPPNGFAADTRTVEVHDPRGCGTTPLFIQYDGRVTGRVVDSRGTPIPALALELVREADVDPSGGSRKQFVRTSADGSFEIRRLPPDAYVLGFNSIGLRNGQLPIRHAFYPGAIERGDARALVVGAGERVRLDDFVIPDAIKLVTVNVTVVDEGGIRVRDAQLEIRDPTGRAYAGGTPIITGDNGRVTLTLLENGKYEVHATMYVGASGDQRVQLGTTAFTATPRSPTLTVVIKPY